jgi:nucleotide-binding universal stress UspA family protein
MGNLGKILVASDLSEFSVHVVERAAMIAAQAHAPLSLVHVMDTRRISALEALTGEWATTRKNRAIQRAQLQLAEGADRLRARYHLHVHTEVIAGQPHEVVAKLAAAPDVALTVIGARSNETLRYTMLGTTSERMLRAIRTPMLIVRNKPGEPYGGVLAAMDFSDASIAATHLAVRIVPNARLAVLRVIDTHFDGLIGLFGGNADDLAEFWTEARVDALAKIEAVIAHLPERPATVSAEVDTGKPADVILHRSRRAGIDLIALGRHGPIRALDVLIGSVAHAVVNRSECDVLISAVSGYDY